MNDPDTTSDKHTPSIAPITDASQINLSAVTYKNAYELIPFKDYTVQYLAVIGAGIICMIFARDVCILLFFGVSFYFSREIRRKKTQLWQRFADSNGWSLEQDAATVHLPPSISEIGHSHKVSDIVSGTAFQNTFKLYDYQYVTGHGKHRRVHTHTVLEMDIANQFPHIVLDSRNNSGGVERIPGNAEQISLEGDFDKYFKLYVQPQYRTDALSIISPDVMHTILKATKGYDIEVIGSKVYLFATGDRRNRQYIADLFVGMQQLLGELNHRAKTFRSSAVAHYETGYKPVDHFGLNTYSGRLGLGIAIGIALMIVGASIAVVTVLAAPH